MKLVSFLLMALFLAGCDSSLETELFCPEVAFKGAQSGMIYSVPKIPDGEKISLQRNRSIENGNRTFELTSVCSGTEATRSEAFIGASCEVGFLYNPQGLICESDNRILYQSKNLSLDGKLKILDLDAPFDSSSSNAFRVLVDDVEVLASTADAEISLGKIQVNPNLEKTLTVLSQDYALTASEGAKVCFEMTSESRSHCFFKNNPSKSMSTETLNTVFDSTIEIDLQNANSFQDLNFRGSLAQKSISALNERMLVELTTYQELDHSGLIFNLEFSLEQDESYRLELETNGAEKNASVEVAFYRKSEFDITNLQDDFIKKFKINFLDSSLRRKKAKLDFTAAPDEQAQELVVVVYGENKSYVRDFKLSKISSQTESNLSLFVTGAPSRSSGFSNYVPDHYVPFGMPQSYGYGSFVIKDDAADYEIYTSYEGKLKTTGAHLYEINDPDHDADLSLNFRGVSNSPPGGDSADFLHGTKALDSGLGYTWSDLETDPATAIFILHTEGGQFALSGGYLKPYDPIGDEVSEGGVSESAPRFNNRIGKTLGDRVLNVQNTNDPDPTVPTKDPMDLSNISIDYFPDLLGRVYVEDDGAGGTRLNTLGDFEGYDTTSEFLFYLYDDQGPEWNAGGPEGALAGTFTKQRSFEDLLNYYTYQAGQDSDGDGVSDYIEYVTGHDPSASGDFPSLSAYDLFNGSETLKVVTFNISKEAVNFGINVYETRPNGVEEIVWSFDRGRGLESANITDVQESETRISITVLANGGPLEISDMRIEFN